MLGAVDYGVEGAGGERGEVSCEAEGLGGELDELAEAPGLAVGEHGDAQAGLDGEAEGLDILDEEARGAGEGALGVALLGDVGEGAGEAEPRHVGARLEAGGGVEAG